jgi:dTDP-4-amino-4,6-dideoxygalactose transaminase
MLRKLPIISSSATFGDMFFALRHRNTTGTPREFSEALSAGTGCVNTYLAGSGISAFYLILKAISKLSPKKEVILSAYTAGSLIVAIRKAGLKPVLCDISLEDFNMDTNAAMKALSENTLAVLAIHMFGIGSRGLGTLRAGMPRGVFLIEDCCQATGSAVGSRAVGASGDISFFSYNRGKNLPLCGGGSISTEDIFIAKAIEDQLRDISGVSFSGELMAVLRPLAFRLFTNPYIYGLAYPLASRFRELAPPGDIRIEKLSNFTAALGARLAKRMKEFALKRYENGMYIINKLRALDGMMLPEISEGFRPAFNRLPVVFKDLERRAFAEARLSEAGVEASRMYLRPLHHMFDLGYGVFEFPNACYFAERLITLPVYPKLSRKDLDRIVRGISGAMR